MTTAATQVVPPDSHRGETRGVVVAATVITIAWIIGVALNRVPARADELAPHQRRAFDHLLPIEHGIFNDLRTVAPEIRALQAEGNAWPEPRQLAELGLPPFVQDPAWKQRGSHSWRLADADHADHAVYWGRPLDRETGEEWVLLISGGAAGVWIRKPVSSRRPSEIPQKLADEGWIELIERKNVYNQ